MSEQVFRVTQVKLHHVVDELRRFHAVPLENTLARDYFVLIHSIPDPANPADGLQPSRFSFRLVADPYATGNLGNSGGNFLVVENQSNTARAPRMHMTIVECLKPEDPSGFRLRDIKQVLHPASTTLGFIEYTDTVSNVQDFKQCWVVGGFWGSGAGGGSTVSSTLTREFLTDNTTLKIRKYSFASFVLNADMSTTCMIVEWGSDWNVYRQDLEDQAILNPVNGYESDLTYEKFGLTDWDGNPLTLDLDNTMFHLSWHSGTHFNGRTHTNFPIVRPGDGLESTLSGDQTEYALAGAENFATSFSLSMYSATNSKVQVSHITPERGTRQMPRTEQSLSVSGPVVGGLSENGPTASSGIDLSYETKVGARIPFIQWTGSVPTDSDAAGPALADFVLDGTSFKYNSEGSTAADVKSQLYVQIADLSNVVAEEVEAAIPTLDEAAKEGTPGLKALLVRELFEVDELVDHCDGRIVGTHEQIKAGDDASSVKMPRIIIEAISGNARWHGGVQNVTIAIYCYSRDGYSDASRMYELVRAKLQHTRINRDGFSPKGLIRETERPHDGYNQQVDGYYIRGLFTYVGTL